MHVKPTSLTPSPIHFHHSSNHSQAASFWILHLPSRHTAGPFPPLTPLLPLPPPPHPIQITLLFPKFHPPAVDALIAALQPGEAGHLPSGRGAVEVHDHVVVGNQLVEGVNHVAVKHQGNYQACHHHGNALLNASSSNQQPWVILGIAMWINNLFNAVTEMNTQLSHHHGNTLVVSPSSNQQPSHPGYHCVDQKLIQCSHGNVYAIKSSPWKHTDCVALNKSVTISSYVDQKLIQRSHVNEHAIKPSLRKHNDFYDFFYYTLLIALLIPHLIFFHLLTSCSTVM